MVQRTDIEAQTTSRRRNGRGDPCARPAKAAPKARIARVDLALQGGGAHGAFTWGVLDRLLEEPWLAFDGISGTSAGAMNAVVMADGLTAGGPEGARAALEAFWRRVSDAAQLSPLRRGPLEILTGSWTLDYSPVFVALDIAARVLSPYDTNPMGTNPLREILEDSVDFERLASGADQAVRHRDQRAHGPRPHLPQRRPHRRRAAGLGLPADDVPGGRDRRRALLGRRLLRQPVDVAADPRVHGVTTRSWCRSTRSSARARRARRARSTTG